MTAPDAKGGIARAFSHRNFLIYTMGNFPSQIGVWAQRVAIGWITWEMTGSPLWLGLMGFADLVPALLFSPIAGYVADRFDRLRLARIIQSLNIIVTVTLTGLAYADLLTVEILLGFVFLTGMDHAFFQPVRASLASVLVTRGDLAAAVAVGSFSWNGARFIGPGVAGLIMYLADANAVFLFNTVSYVGFLVALFSVRLSAPPKRAPSAIGIFAQVMEGYRYALGHPAIRPLLIMLGCASFLTRPLVELLPGFAASVFGRDVNGLAMLTSAMGVGAACAGLWIAQRGRLQGMTRITTHTLLMAPVVLIAFSQTTNFTLGVILMVFAGFQYVILGACTQTLIQTVAEERMRGRVLAFYGLVWMGGAALGALVMGALSEKFGLGPPIAVGGFLCIGVWFWAARVMPRIAKIVEQD
jgi:MFS family permease